MGGELGMSLLARLFTFIDQTPAEAAEVNAELDQIIAELNYGVIHADGMNAFTAEQVGITPTTAASLATKGYVDSLGGGGGAAVVRKTADQVYASGAAVNDTMLKFAGLANTKYMVRATVLGLVTGSTALITGGLFGPAGATWVGRIQGASGTGNIGTGLLEGVGLSQFTEANLGQWAIGTIQKLFDLTAIVLVGATPGDVGLRANVVTGGQTLTVKTNSIITSQII